MQVLFGAVANSFEPGFFEYYDNVLDILDSDPQARGDRLFPPTFSPRTATFTRGRRISTSTGRDKPCWRMASTTRSGSTRRCAGVERLSRPGVDGTSAFRATKEEQADYTIQSAFYAIMGGAEAIFHFQLMDGCGNQPAGTIFLRTMVRLCDANGNLISGSEQTMRR